MDLWPRGRSSRFHGETRSSGAGLYSARTMLGDDGYYHATIALNRGPNVPVETVASQTYPATEPPPSIEQVVEDLKADVARRQANRA